MLFRSESMKYPMIVKPAYWAMGLGVSVVHNVHDLRGVIGLAGGSDTSLVVQPYFEGVRERRSALTPARRIGRPEDMADAVLFLASGRASFVTGQELVVDGGYSQMLMSLVPRPGF